MGLSSIFGQKTALEEEERFILCIDGGGMRGLVPAVLLEKLSMLLESIGDNRPLYSHFDLIAGTSTGGLLALALTAPVQKTTLQIDPRYISYIYEKPMQRVWQRLLSKKQGEQLLGTLPFGVDIASLQKLYINHGMHIFPKNQGRLLSQIFIDKYDEQPLEQFLKQIFGDIPLEEAVVPTLVVSYDAANGKPFFFNSKDAHDFLFWEAARATSAAPTFFKPAYLYDRKDKQKLSLIDGGVVANNPSLYAYKTAKKMYPNAKKFHILSLSTASSDFTFTISGTGTGVIGWIDPAKGAPIQKIYATSQMQVVDHIAQTIEDINYCRIHGSLGQEYKLDTTNPLALSSMIKGAEVIFEQQKTQLSEFATLLSKRTTFDQLKLGPKEVEPPVVVKQQPTLPLIEEQEGHSLFSSYYSFLQRYKIEEESLKEPPYEHPPKTN
jgi:patatin-like phospholipase/acyl hydrolase